MKLQRGKDNQKTKKFFESNDIEHIKRLLIW